MVESLEFRTEVQQLLNILAHSLYTEREIFLRELISNASDALHRMQFIALTDRNLVDPAAELAIHLKFDEAEHSLVVSDTGVGMTHDELIENLGTIAHSGALAFLQNLDEGKRVADMIGQFGVGFYSVFMVAEEVVVTTRSYLPDAPAWQWTSTGSSQFKLEPADKATRGTDILIRLKEDAYEFAAEWRLEQIVRRHSDYVSFPIYLGDKAVNRRHAPWRKPLNEVQPGEYDDFYRQLTLDPEPPLLHVHIITDAPVEIRSILYVPRKLDRESFRMRNDHGPALFSRKVLIQEHSPELLPEYLGFVAGVVDSEDVPLNISRETVQSNRIMRQIQKVLAGRVVKALRELAGEHGQDYALFWQEFGPFLKQGLVTNAADRDDLLPLLRFTTSKSEGQLASLNDYVGRMTADQEAIYYILGTDLAATASSPHLDAFRARGLEVLFLLDPFDGLMVQGLRDYESKPFHNVDDPTLQLPATSAPEPEANAESEEPDLAPLIARAKMVLGDRVSEVRVSKLLTGSPCRLLSTGTGVDRDLQRVRRLLEQDFQEPAKILELNPRHPIVRNLTRLAQAHPADPRIEPVVAQLFDDLLLLDGVHPNPAGMVPRIQQLLEAATKD